MIDEPDARGEPLSCWLEVVNRRTDTDQFEILLTPDDGGFLSPTTVRDDEKPLLCLGGALRIEGFVDVVAGDEIDLPAITREGPGTVLITDRRVIGVLLGGTDKDGRFGLDKNGSGRIYLFEADRHDFTDSDVLFKRFSGSVKMAQLAGDKRLTIMPEIMIDPVHKQQQRVDAGLVVSVFNEFSS